MILLFQPLKTIVCLFLKGIAMKITHWKRFSFFNS